MKVGDFLYICIMEHRDYYVYCHINSQTGEPFYIGKGRGTRSTVYCDRGKYWDDYTQLNDWEVVFLETNLTNDQSYDLETYWIKRVGRKNDQTGSLVNLNDGGKYDITKRKQILQIAKELGFTYDPITGHVYNSKGIKVGSPHKTKRYIRISHTNFYFKAHQFAWYVTYGDVVELIDHINNDREDNRIINLRESDAQKNQFNKKSKGYYYDKRRKKNPYIVRIRLNGKTINLGSCPTEEDAIKLYLEHKSKLHII